MAETHALSGLTRPLLLFLKATTKKQVFIPTFTRKDGVVVLGHHAMVHITDDHDPSKILTGAGSHSQKAAHAQLVKHDWFHELPHDIQLPVLLKHATEIQDKASALAGLSVFRKKILAGSKPSKAEWNGFASTTLEKQQSLIEEFTAAGKGAQFAEWYDAHLAAGTPAAAAIPEPAPAEVPAPVPPVAEPTPVPDLPKIIAAEETPAPTQEEPIAPQPAELTDIDAHLAAIAAAKVPESNTNAKSANPKLQAIADATAAGDVKTLLMMGFGTNTYGTKAAKLANVSLKLLGSEHQVAPGQKMASHPGMVDTQAAPAAIPLPDKPEQVIEPVSVPTAEPGPNEGDTKEGADGMLVFKDGHWHKQDVAPAAAPKAKVGKSKVIGAKVATPAPPVTMSTAAAPGGVESIEAWKKTGPQKGYNPGGTYEDAAGVEWYCKFPAGGEKVAKNELLAAKLYQLAGVDAAEVKLITQGGKVGIASKIVPGAVQDKAALLAGTAGGLLSGFATDAWLANWDTVGNNPSKGFDNILIAPSGEAVRIDAGGALLYGGAGGKKQAFGEKVPDLKTMLDPKKNANTAAVFGKMTSSDIAASVAKVLAIPDESIIAYCEEFGPGSQADRSRLAAKLIARKADMLEQYPGAGAKPKKLKPAKPAVPKFNPDELGKAPDFLNWKGVGQSGPATLHAKNVANQEGVNALLAAAKTGKVEAVKALSFPIYDKSGALTHMASAADHPSQYIRGYAQQLINEIQDQLTPKVKVRLLPGSALALLNDLYPVIKSVATAAVKKAGNYLVLGKPGVVTADSLGLKKNTFVAGTLPDTKYATVAQAALAKMPALQKSAIKSYTGSGYGGQNKSMWSGNPSGQAQSAAEALHTHAHDIEPGDVLSRRISLSGTALEDIVGHWLPSGVHIGGTVGMVLQEPAIGSTGTNPDFWHGNVQLKMTVGPGCKGLWVGNGSATSGGAASSSGNEREIIFPPNYRMLVTGIKRTNGAKDEDGFGGQSQYVVEVIVLPT